MVPMPTPPNLPPGISFFLENNLEMPNGWNKPVVQMPRGQPHSQALSFLPPLVVGRETLVSAGHVATCDTNCSTGVESANFATR